MRPKGSAAELEARRLRAASLLGPHHISVVHDGLTALETAKKFKPQIIFLDIGLPQLDGYQVAKALRREPNFVKTSIVALTGYGSEENRRDAFGRGLRRARGEAAGRGRPRACVVPPDVAGRLRGTADGEASAQSFHL
jgi:CheY-like chemotaxis protein